MSRPLTCAEVAEELGLSLKQFYTERPELERLGLLPIPRAPLPPTDKSGKARKRRRHYDAALVQRFKLRELAPIAGFSPADALDHDRPGAVDHATVAERLRRRAIALATAAE